MLVAQQQWLVYLAFPTSRVPSLQTGDHIIRCFSKKDFDALFTPLCRLNLLLQSLSHFWSELSVLSQPSFWQPFVLERQLVRPALPRIRVENELAQHPYWIPPDRFEHFVWIQVLLDVKDGDLWLRHLSPASYSCPLIGYGKRRLLLR